MCVRVKVGVYRVRRTVAPRSAGSFSPTLIEVCQCSGVGGGSGRLCAAGGGGGGSGGGGARRVSLLQLLLSVR